MVEIDRSGDRGCQGILAQDFWRKRGRLFISAFPPWRSDLLRPAAVKGTPFYGVA
jgi:hypothetical protein